MKKFFVCMLCLLMVLFSACQSDLPAESTPQLQETVTQPTDTQPVNTQPTESQPAAVPVTGTLQTDLLEVSSDFSRCGETSTGTVWETESGFYDLAGGGILYYADRTMPDTWVPVCTKPDCTHNPLAANSTCDAIADEFMVINDRIYKRQHSVEGLFTLVSTALDGTDQRTEFVFSEAPEMQAMGAGTGRTVMTPEYLVGYISVLNPQGNYDFRIYTADENGVVTQIAEERESMGGFVYRCDSGGGLWFNGNAIIDDSSRTVVFTLQDGELVSVDLTGLWFSGAYLSREGDRVWNFRPNDGYYLVDTATGAEVKLAEPQIENSGADIALPNCIIESTLFRDCRSYTFETQQMWLFDGQQWHEITLPEELLNIGENQYLQQNVTVASDRIFLKLMTKNQSAVQLYQILLGTDTPVLEYLCTLG